MMHLLKLLLLPLFGKLMLQILDFLHLNERLIEYPFLQELVTQALMSFAPHRILVNHSLEYLHDVLLCEVTALISIACAC